MSILDRILTAINSGLASLQASADETLAAVQACDHKLDQILQILLEPVAPAGTTLTITLEDDMTTAKKAVKKAVLNIQLLDTGKALVTVGFVDSLGETATAAPGATISTSFTSSDPGVTVIGRGDGLTADVALVSPAPNPLPTGVVITSVTTVTNADASVLGPFTATGAPIDVIAGGPAGTTMVEAPE